jgi:Arc/MetJ family transcription regulator
LCKKEAVMATNLALDDDLIIQAQKIGHHRSKKEAVTIALKDYIAQKKQQKIVELFGRIDFDEKYNYKKARMR